MVLLLLALTVVAIALTWALSARRHPHGAATWFLVFYCCFVMFGYVSHFIDAGMPAQGPAATGLTVVTIGLLAALTGSAAASQSRPGDEDSPGLIRVRTGDRNLVVMSLVIFVPAWMYFFFLGSVPLMEGLGALASQGGDGLGELQRARLERDPYVNSGAQAVPLQGLLELYRNVGTPGLFAATLLRWRKLGYRHLYLILSILSVITVMAAGQRWPLQYLLFAALFALGLDKGRLPLRAIAKLGALGIALGAVLSVLQARNSPVEEGGLGSLLVSGAQAVLDRTFLGYVETPILSYQLDDPRLESLSGSTYIQSLLAYLPGPGQSYSATFYSIVYGSDAGFTAPPDFSTELYINWGFSGVVAGALLWGFVLSRVDRWIGRRQFDAEAAGLVIVAILSLSVVATSGLATSLRILFVVVPVIVALRALGSSQPVQPSNLQQGDRSEASSAALVREGSTRHRSRSAPHRHSAAPRSQRADCRASYPRR